MSVFDRFGQGTGGVLFGQPGYKAPERPVLDDQDYTLPDRTRLEFRDEWAFHRHEDGALIGKLIGGFDQEARDRLIEMNRNRCVGEIRKIRKEAVMLAMRQPGSLAELRDRILMIKAYINEGRL